MDFFDSFLYGGVLGMIGAACAMIISKAGKSSNNTATSEKKDDIIENSTEVIKQIEKLADLKEQGIITDEEFESKKHKLLEKI